MPETFYIRFIVNLVKKMQWSGKNPIIDCFDLVLAKLQNLKHFPIQEAAIYEMVLFTC